MGIFLFLLEGCYRLFSCLDKIAKKSKSDSANWDVLRTWKS